MEQSNEEGQQKTLDEFKHVNDLKDMKKVSNLATYVICLKSSQTTIGEHERQV